MNPTPSPRRIYVKTFGCQMNVYDSERVGELMRPLGYAPTDAAEDADLVVLNTCHIREKATEKVYSELGRLKAVKARRTAAGGGMIIVVAGCVAQAEGAEIMRRQPAVDFAVGPQSYQRLPELIARTHRAVGERLAADFAPEEKFDTLGALRDANSPTAFLTVQEGCDKFCAFCVVPYTRGAEYSRPSEQILEEARNLTEKGVREITLLGQNVNAYMSDLGLAGLIRMLAGIKGLERIRYTTSHPRDMDQSLIAAHAEVEALMPYLHLPVQSGSDRILRAMNRGHTAAQYLDVVERVRMARPDMALSSDFIVGFPGESDADFEATLELVEKVGFASSFSFKYSRRPGTPGAVLPGQVDERVKAERLSRLQALLATQQAAFNSALVGRTAPVLFDRPGRILGEIVGRSPWLQAVHCRASLDLIGRVATVAITSAGANSVAGHLCLEAA
ncbi:MAG TPA: tRNA (N6-isopentenyl adenosine(37)-C2)-methylthiotransferase MiaB [Caulobacteraceae bacterium]